MGYQQKMRILGLDEAGRGCVLGPLVVGAFYFEGADQAVLKAAGAADSKQLSPQKRDQAREKLALLGTGETVRVEATAIDEGNINTLEVEAFIAMARKYRPDRVYLDAPVHPRGVPKLKAHLIKASGVEDWVVEPKADATYPVVGAASIFAKTTRDGVIEELEATIGGIGSGYPSDPVTRKLLMGYLQRNEPFPSWVRSRWGTIEALKDELKQARLF